MSMLQNPTNWFLPFIRDDVALLDVPRQLILHVHYALYTDDVNVWTDTDFPENYEVNSYASSFGLQCSPQKSELVIVRKHPPAFHTEPVCTTSTTIPYNPPPRFKFQPLPSRPTHVIKLSKVSKAFHQVSNMLRRASCRRGWKEDLVQLKSRLT